MRSSQTGLPTFPQEAKRYYFFYSDYSEFVHGNIHFNFRPNSFDSPTPIISRLALEVVKLNDWFLNGGKYSEELLEFINKYKLDIDELR